MSEKKRLVIIGSGPSGYTAGIYAARAQMQPEIYTGVESGGQLMYTSELENFPGFPEGVVGPKFMWDLRQQAARFGAVIKDQLITAVDLTARPFKLWTSLPPDVKADEYKRANAERLAEITAVVKQQPPELLAEAVIVSTGAGSIMLGLSNEMGLLGKGLSTCAVCDAAFFKQKKVFVVGGGDSAMEDSLALVKFTDQVTLIHRRDSFRASKIMQERVLNHPNITVQWNSSVVEIHGEDKLSGIVIETTQKDGAKTREMVAADGLFLAIGHRPVSGLFMDQLQVDAHGYIMTRQSYTKGGLEMASQALHDDLVSFPTMTSVEGVFAAGDVVDVRYKQAVTAAGMGCQAALDAERWLERQPE
jgi:thioredoxin reductase (NADPH)